MSELMGICGADAQTTSRILDRMQAHVRNDGGLHVDRWEGPGLGLLRFHHGVVDGDAQPIANEDGSLLVAMNGEVFGGEGMRGLLVRQGHRFRHPRSSAELALHLYEQRGAASFKELSGSFSIVLYDVPARRLVLVTDPFFSRSVFYCRMGNALVFSSRFNALVACGALDGGRLDMTAVMQFFTFQHAQHVHTYYREAKAMLPASVLRFEDRRISTSKYWRFQYEAVPGTLGEYAERLADAIRKSVRERTSDGLRHGVMLSGGMDARTLVAAAERPMTAYTMADYVNREVTTARRIARTKGWQHVFVQRPPGHYGKIVDEAVELCGGMARFDNAHFLRQLDLPRRECDVLFVEELMDPLFKGIYWERRQPIRGYRIPWPGGKACKSQGIEEQILRIDCKSTFPSRPWLLFREPWRSRYREIMYATIREQLADADTSNPYDAVAHVGGMVGLGRVEAFMNVTCVRPYLEFRSLCLDAELLRLSLQMPVRYRMDGRALKLALRRLDPRLWAVPYANTGLRLDAPELMAWVCRMGSALRLGALRKLGRVPPTHTNESWSDRGEALRIGTLRDVLEETLGDPQCFDPAVFDTDRLGTICREHMSRRHRHMRMLLCLLTFGRWSRQYGPRML